MAARRASTKLLKLLQSSAVRSCAEEQGTLRSCCSVQQRGRAALAQEAFDEAPPNSKDGKVLHPDLINADMRSTVYAVRGELMQRGEELRKAGREIIFTNSANCAKKASCVRSSPDLTLILAPGSRKSTSTGPETPELQQAGQKSQV